MCKRSFHTNNIRAIKRIGAHNLDVISVIIGSLLGNASVSRISGEGVRILFRCSHKDYMFWLYEFFYSKGYTSSAGLREYTRKIKHTQKVYKGYEFNTFTFRSLNWIYELFYKKGIKVISIRLTDYITPLALAVWIMNNGLLVTSGIRIATPCGTLIEVTILNDILKNKYNLDTTIQSIRIDAIPSRQNRDSVALKNVHCAESKGSKGSTDGRELFATKCSKEQAFVKKSSSLQERYCIYIKKKSIHKLICIVKPYMHKSMYYKLGLRKV
uniref:Putative intron-encoded protein n=1 Tax=Chaetosphaeridium globosum TaxID=96477 RepID=Q8M1F2_CHAGL|nr:putative intron-encoded protein [Chaetosphaeridium globosum]AAM96638.1 putative intron-encoded protein [Chaetosphaeridium globosum]